MSILKNAAPFARNTNTALVQCHLAFWKMFGSKFGACEEEKIYTKLHRIMQLVNVWTQIAFHCNFYGLNFEESGKKETKSHLGGGKLFNSCLFIRFCGVSIKLYNSRSRTISYEKCMHRK